MRLELVLVLVHMVAESQRTLDTKLQGWWKWLYCVIQWTLCAHSPGSGLGTGSTWWTANGCWGMFWKLGTWHPKYMNECSRSKHMLQDEAFFQSVCLRKQEFYLFHSSFYLFFHVLPCVLGILQEACLWHAEARNIKLTRRPHNEHC